jgi:hypothetical protein
MSRLITPSLFNSFQWLQKCKGEAKETAYQQLVNMLTRVYPDTMPHAIKRGIDFENAVYTMLSKIENKNDIEKINSSDLFKQVLYECYGGVFQHKSKSFLTIDGKEYCLYGKLDVFFPNNKPPKIIDIKTTKFKKSTNYCDTMQHKIYCYNEKVKHFDYLVVMMNNKDELVKIQQEHYEVESFDDLKKDIEENIKYLMNYFEMDSDLMRVYKDKYCLY